MRMRSNRTASESATIGLHNDATALTESATVATQFEGSCAASAIAAMQPNIPSVVDLCPPSATIDYAGNFANRCCCCCSNCYRTTSDILERHRAADVAAVAPAHRVALDRSPSLACRETPVESGNETVAVR